MSPHAGEAQASDQMLDVIYTITSALELIDKDAQATMEQITPEMETAFLNRLNSLCQNAHKWALA